jgi:diacylglycerol kinase
MTAEMINTAIETVVDLVSPSNHELASKAKDVAAGAVLLSAFFSAIAGLMIFVPKLLAVL